jgi:toxin ParE1/3/4
MRERPVTYRRAAINDLSEIYWHIRTASGQPHIAEQFVRRIKARYEKIGHAPSGGRRRDDLMVGLRVIPFERSAVIAYLIEAKRVRILNVFYGRRDYENIITRKIRASQE